MRTKAEEEEEEELRTLPYLHKQGTDKLPFRTSQVLALERNTTSRAFLLSLYSSLPIHPQICSTRALETPLLMAYRCDSLLLLDVGRIRSAIGPITCGQVVGVRAAVAMVFG